MPDILFYTLLIVLLYYFFIYLPQQKKLIANASQPLANPPLKHSQGTQTDESIIVETEPLIGPEAINCPGPQYEKDEKNKELAQLKTKNHQLTTEITKLQTQIRTLVKKPLKPTSFKSTQTDSEEDLTNTLDIGSPILSCFEKQLDTLIKNIQDFNRELD